MINWKHDTAEFEYVFDGATANLTSRKDIRCNLNETHTKLEFVYGVDNQRIITKLYNGDKVTKKKYFIGNYEVDSTSAGIRQIHYIAGGDGLAAVHIIDKDNVGKTYYTYSDHLGSIIAITDNNGAMIPNGEQSFDPWGRRRNITNWTNTGAQEITLIDRGYTGHEHLNEFGIINMNGRLYDPLLGRILSPDPFVQDPSNTQNFNRYSYCFNNPLKYTDPSGYLNQTWTDIINYLWGHTSPDGSSSYNVNGDYSNSNGMEYQSYGGNLSSIMGIVGEITGVGVGGGGGNDADLAAQANVPPIIIKGVGLHTYSYYQAWNEVDRVLRGYDNYISNSQYFNGTGNYGTYGLISSENEQVDYKHQGGGTSSSTNSAPDAQIKPLNINVTLLDLAPKQDYSGLIGQVDYFLNNGYADGFKYDSDGNPIGLAPTMGMPPAFGNGKMFSSIGNAYKFLKNSRLSDWIRYDKTLISNQIVKGKGVPGATVGKSLKGGGKLYETGENMGFHYHIHGYNWYKPWTWFKQTPIIKP